MTLPVGVIGAAGRMGATVCRAVSAADGMDLVAEVDLDTPSGLDALTEAGAAIAVDFTVAGVAVDNARWCAAHGLHCVIGTTGIGPDEQAVLDEAFPAEGPLGCIVAPNFAIGAVLMMHFAAVAAPYFETAEIIELHHDGKIDAPSGTAMATAAGMEAASAQWAADPTTVVVAAGARGGLSAGGGVRIHSVRMRGMVAHQEVILGTTGQTLTIRHDSMDRESFMPGVLAAVRAVSSRPGLTIGLDRVLGL
ncbi:MAG TPA: 4-hydroxy-tetrahydrodipicolinate reductase [Acidimicrobiales bacterium]|nr:4-hydroxy-tetrahydrodipicolinate reductase [Acidimicrobiales bacterium]